MRKAMIQIVTLAVLAGSGFTANADEVTDKDKQLEHGKKMHNEHCYKCHTDKVYTRDDRFVKSLNALSKQVVRCKDNLGIPWFDEDTEAVVHFLNEKYYRF
jgi:CxxC motif-containing protein (DUF1111 family)